MLDMFNGTELAIGEEIARGKTKIISTVLGKSGVVDVFNMNTLTAGNGKKSAVIVGKGLLCNEIACRVFELFRARGIPVAYFGPNGRRAFLAPQCTMLPYEIVVRFVAEGSFVKRNPHIARGTALDTPVVELYLKTSGQRFGDLQLPCDDPYMTWDYKTREACLWLPDIPLSQQRPVAIIRPPHVQHLKQIMNLSLKAWTMLRDELALQDAILEDGKDECGFDQNGRILIADVITADEWRMSCWGVQLSKQFFRDDYRDWRDDAELLHRYQWAADLTRRFSQ